MLILVGVIRILGNVGSPRADVEATLVGVVDAALKRSLVDVLCQATPQLVVRHVGIRRPLCEGGLSCSEQRCDENGSINMFRGNAHSASSDCRKCFLFKILDA